MQRAHRIRWISVLLILSIAFAVAGITGGAFVFASRVNHMRKALVSREALEKMIRAKEAVSATLGISERAYEITALKRGLSILSASDAPTLDPPELLYSTLLLPDNEKEGILYLFWLEYDFRVNGIVLGYSNGDKSTYLVFNDWNKGERTWFGKLAHRDMVIRVLDGPLMVNSVSPRLPSISEPLERLRNVRTVQLHFFNGRVGRAVKVFFVDQRLRAPPLDQ